MKTTILILFLFYFLGYSNAEENNIEIIDYFNSTTTYGKDKTTYDLIFKTNNFNNFYIGIGTSINSFILNYFDIELKTLTRLGFNTKLNECLLFNLNYEEKNNIFNNYNLEENGKEYSLSLNLNYRF